MTLGPRGLPLPFAVSRYRSKFIRAAGAVAINRHNLDLLLRRDRCRCAVGFIEEVQKNL
jgi:hypothetical protein